MASETGSKYSGIEGTIQFFLGALFEIIVDRVDYQHLMNSLPCDMLSYVQEKEIHNIKQKDGPAAATKRILEMVKASKKPGKYQALVDALKRDYLILSKALTGHPLPDDSIQKNIIKVFSSNITERMSTIQLLPYLIRSSVIVQLEKEMVEAELRNYGNTRGAQLLLLHLPAHVENWYTEFLKALCDSDQKDLAKFIDESFTRKYITSSNTGVMKTDADAQLYLSRKEDSFDTDLSDDEIPKEVRIQEEKEEDVTERKEMSLENTAYDSVASDEKEEVQIPLRKYQEELARPALHGKNVIIMAPTGSGKTRVVFKLIQDHFHRLRDKYAKVVLLVKNQALADQHGKTCKELLPKYRSQAINRDIKRDKGISLGVCIEKQDILVVAAQLLLNSLINGEIKSITQFSLLIFDECHHCHDDHAYNKIMQLYRDIKLTPEADTSSLPQIIGLTASIGVGKAIGNLQAKEHIKKIMANMDAELISTVKDNLDELYQYVPTTSSDPVIPSEVLNMDPISIEMYRKALRNGIEKVFNIRIMVVGPYDVGKTTLIKRLLGKEVNIRNKQSTEGIDIQTDCCKVSLATGEWITQEQTEEEYLRLQWLVKLLNEQVQQKSIDKEEVPKEMETAKQDNGHAQYDLSVRSKQDIDEEVMPTLSQPVESSIAILSPETSSDVARENEKKDLVMEILQLVNANSDKLENSFEEYAKLGMWDFAGQHVFYTQIFLSYHAVYLLVIDLSQQITASIKETINKWMNLIHSCTPSPQSGIPAVILVGTHVDKILKRNRHEVCKRYFKEVHSYLSDKPTMFHLVNEDFAIDNTVVDSNLVDLKKKIVEVASQQPYWGEEVPARWILPERELMRLKSAGIKVIPRTLFEAFNWAEDVSIPTEELDLFLKFHNDIGTILYFNIEVLKDKIVLVPQWMIDAVKSLITADEMFVQRNAPAVSEKWDMFNKSGKLYPELIDAIWTKEQNPDLHDNKEHILLLMEHLNIIARPRSISEDLSEIKVEDYYLAPCMLREAVPTRIISPESDPEIGNTSVLCFVCTAKFLPPPVFHRLLGACLTEWPIAKQLSQNLIYYGCCVFDLDSVHQLTIHFKDYVIFTRVKGVGVINMDQSSEVCRKVKSVISENLSRIIETFGQSMQFELHVQCPKTDPESLEGLIAVSKLQKSEKVRCDSHENSHILESQNLLKFWFEDEEVSDAGSSAGAMPSPPTSDTDRFMCIAYLLVDVGSRVLRQLLTHHTVTSTCTLDQYLAKNMSTINSLRRVFNQSQIDIMFPPNGDDTNLDDYDITLLSALFQNIVPTLSQPEKDMIKTLREERNKLYGHAKSCQISANDFQTYWNDISSTLTTLSQQCGDTAFEAKILQEIQRTKVSAIPAGSYLDIFKTWFDMLQDVTTRLQALESNKK